MNFIAFIVVILILAYLVSVAWPIFIVLLSLFIVWKIY